MDALLEEGLQAPKKRRVENEKYGGESDHQSDGETSVQPMMTKIKTVLKSKLLSLKYLYLFIVGGGREFWVSQCKNARTFYNNNNYYNSIL